MHRKKNDAEQKANLLFVNNGNNTFSEKAAEYGLADTGYSVQAAFVDYDVDGDVDMYLLTNARELLPRNVPRPKKVRGEGSSTDRLYRNNGNGTFTNVSGQAGITIEGYGLGVAISDINQDGWPDIYWPMTFSPTTCCGSITATALFPIAYGTICGTRAITAWGPILLITIMMV